MTYRKKTLRIMSPKFRSKALFNIEATYKQKFGDKVVEDHQDSGFEENG
jgi:hypothetical protein